MEMEEVIFFSKEKWNNNLRLLIWRNIYIEEMEEPISFEQIEIQIFLLQGLKNFWLTTILILLNILLKHIR